MIINDKYKIESDGLNVTLFAKKAITGTGDGEQPTKRKAGEEYWRAIAYFSTPQNCLEYLVNHEVKGTGMADLKAVVAKIDELERLIRSLDLPPKHLR